MTEKWKYLKLKIFYHEGRHIDLRLYFPKIKYGEHSDINHWIEQEYPEVSIYHYDDRNDCIMLRFDDVPGFLEDGAGEGAKIHEAYHSLINYLGSFGWEPFQAYIATRRLSNINISTMHFKKKRNS